MNGKVVCANHLGC